MIFAFFLINFGQSFSQISKRSLKSDFVLKSNQQKEHQKLLDNIEQLSNINLTNKKIDQIKHTFYDVSLMLFKHPKVKLTIQNILDKTPNDELIISAIKTAKVLYPIEFKKQISNIFQSTDNIEIQLNAYYYLLENNLAKKDSLINLIKENKSLQEQLARSETTEFLSVENIGYLLSNKFFPNELIIYSFLRKDRTLTGRSVLRLPNGNFSKENDSTYFSIPQLAYSVYNLPYFMDDGNTPQGLYSFQGFYASPKASIGPTAALIIRTPFEVGFEKFFHNKYSAKNWNFEKYLSVLPSQIRNLSFWKESFYAGKLGRTLIVIHGSTDNPMYYENEKYFPLTPSTGCLTSYEKWSSENGKLMESDQLKLVNQILKTKRRKGYLVVIELDDKEENISYKEVANLIKLNKK